MSKQVAIQRLGPSGKIIAGSKGRYNFNNPNNFVVFNANLINEEIGMFWKGDIDVTKDLSLLKDLAEEMGSSLYIMSESNANSKDVDLTKASVIIDAKGNTAVGNHLKEYIDADTLTLKESRNYSTPAFGDHECNISVKSIKSELVVKQNFEGTLDKSPLEQFYEHILSKTSDIETVSEIIVNKKLAASLHAALVDWADRNRKHLQIVDDYSFSQAVAFTWFNYAPVCGKFKGMRDDTVYIRSA